MTLTRSDLRMLYGTYVRELWALLRATLPSLRATADKGRHNRWTNRTVLTNPPALVVNSVVAVVPPFVVMMATPNSPEPRYNKLVRSNIRGHARNTGDRQPRWRYLSR